MAGLTAGPHEGTLGELEKGWLGTHVHLCVRVCLCVSMCVHARVVQACVACTWSASRGLDES